MTKRNVLMVLVLSFVTFGIYSLYWLVATKIEMNERGANIPTAFLLLVPIANIYWVWKYSEGVEHVTESELTGPVAFLLLLLLGMIGAMVVQAKLNEVPDRSELPMARVHNA